MCICVYVYMCILYIYIYIYTHTHPDVRRWPGYDWVQLYLYGVVVSASTSVCSSVSVSSSVSSFVSSFVSSSVSSFVSSSVSSFISSSVSNPSSSSVSVSTGICIVIGIRICITISACTCPHHSFACSLQSLTSHESSRFAVLHYPRTHSTLCRTALRIAQVTSSSERVSATSRSTCCSPVPRAVKRTRAVP